METTSASGANACVLAESPSLGRKYRVQLDVDANDFDLINQLVSDLDVGTRAELFRSGLRVLRWMIRKKREGSTVCAITPDRQIFEPEFDFMMHVEGPKDIEQLPPSTTRRRKTPTVDQPPQLERTHSHG